jgi:hypothetical protein
MNTYQLQTENGMIIGVYEAITPVGALDKYAKKMGYEDYHKMSSYLHLDPSFKVDGHRITVSGKRRNPMATPIRIPEKVLSWRERLRKGIIMKPRTFKSIKRKGAARYKKKGVGKKVAGKAYQITLLRKYLDVHPGDKYVERILKKLVRRRYGRKIKKNPRPEKWYIGLYDTGGITRFHGSVIFPSSVKPTRDRFPKYKKVIGPFNHFNEAEKYREEKIL